MVMNFRNSFKKSETKEQKPINNIGLTPESSVLLEPKQIDINGYKFIISKMPCTVAQEVILRLPSGLIPMLNNFDISQEMAFKMLSYCQRVHADGRSVPLISKEIIDNQVPNFQTLLQLEQECMTYNYDFFANGKLLDFLSKGVSLVESKASAILTDLLDKLLLQEKQP